MVIPTTYYRDEKLVFLSPRSQYEVYDHKIGGEDTSNSPFQSPNNNSNEDLVRSEQESTKVEKLVKNMDNFEAQKIAVIQAKQFFPLG